MTDFSHKDVLSIVTYSGLIGYVKALFRIFLIPCFLGGGVIAESEPVTSPAYSLWAGEWEGQMVVYSPVGDRLSDIHVSFSSPTRGPTDRGIQRVSILTKSHGLEESVEGYFFTDKKGLRRIVKGSLDGSMTDLRGRVLAPGKLYWFSVDSEGILRESYIETFDGNQVHIQGFHWNGRQNGSYRIIQATYIRKSESESKRFDTTASR
jgi:hypothetical protein